MPQGAGQGEAAVAASSSEPEMPVRAEASGPLPQRRAAEVADSLALPLLLVQLGGGMSQLQATPPSMPVAQEVPDTPMTTAHGEQQRRTDSGYIAISRRQHLRSSG